MEEVWEDIEGYDGAYRVSNTGKVKSFKMKYSPRGNFLKPAIHSYGYRKVTLRKDGKSKQVFLHRLVAETFIEKIQRGMVINHKDENKANNRVDNLEIITSRENTMYSRLRRKECELR